MTFRSLENFYRADPLRGASREHDYGLLWREQATGELHRAAWISDTGELYLARLGAGEQPVEVLVGRLEQAEVELRLEGWREACCEPDGLAWLRAHATARRAAPVRRRTRVAAAAGAAAAALVPPAAALIERG